MPRVTLTANECGVAQQSRLFGDTDSQLPPLPLAATGVKPISELSVASIFRICVSGLAPPNDAVKLRGFTCTKTLLPTVTATGMVTLSPLVLRSSSPTKVPAVAPPPGRADGVMPMETRDGAVPLEAVVVNHVPPLAVLAVRVQLRVPAPAFRI